MRIDLHVGSADLNRAVKASGSERPSQTDAEKQSRPAIQNDQAHLSLNQARIQSLEDHLIRLPEVRSDKTQPLKKAVEDATYQPAPERVADAVYSELLARSSLIR